VTKLAEDIAEQLKRDPDLVAAELRDHPSTMVRQFMLGSPDGPVPFHYPADNFLDDVLGDA